MKSYLYTSKILLLITFFFLINAINPIITIEVRKTLFKKKLNNNNLINHIFKQKNDDTLLGSFNFISNPHYFPETGLDNNYNDLMGLKYNFKMIDPFKILQGQLSVNSDFQLTNIAKNIFENFNKFQNKAPLKAFNVLTLSQRLRRSIESAQILNKKLNKLFKLTDNDKTNSIKPFNMSIYNNTDLKDTEIHEKNPENPLITYFIPKIYDSEIFPIHFKVDEYNCPKIINDFKTNLNNEALKNTYRNLSKGIQDSINIEEEEFDFFENNFVKISLNFNNDNTQNNSNTDFTREYTLKNLILNSYQNFIEIHNYFEITKNIDNFKDNSFKKSSILEMLKYKTSVKGFSFLDKPELLPDNKSKFLRNIIKKQKELLQLLNFDLFYIKNYSEDFIKLYSSDIFKLVMNVIYTYISPSQNEINKNLKNTILLNLFLKDYQLAGIYQILTKIKKPLDPETKIIDTKELPNITYGSVITLNVLEKKENVDQENIINNYYVQILIDFKVIKTIAITEILNGIVNYISNDPLFPSNACQ